MGDSGGWVQSVTSYQSDPYGQANPRWQILSYADIERDEKIVALNQQVTALTREVGKLTTEVSRLEGIIADMGSKFTELLASLKDSTLTSQKVLSNQRAIIAEEVAKAVSQSGDHITENTVVIRSITREEAKKEIMELLDKSDKLYYYDIAEALNLDLELVVNLIAELESEGMVGEANNA